MEKFDNYYIDFSYTNSIRTDIISFNWGNFEGNSYFGYSIPFTVKFNILSDLNEIVIQGKTKKVNKEIDMIYPQSFEPKIGFDHIRQLLKDKCLSTLGEEQVTEMMFSDIFEEVKERLNLVAEFVRIVQEEDNFPAQFFFDLRPSLKRIRVEGMGE